VEIVALIVGSVALVAAGWLVYEVLTIKRRVAAVPADGDVFKALRELDSDLASVEAAVADVAPRVAGLESRMPHAITHTGVVSYDAFDNITGNQSKSIALLNDAGAGVVISMLVGRNETLVFTKQIVGGNPNEPLSPEERNAMRTALSR
jgi:hypothetical protein